MRTGIKALVNMINYDDKASRFLHKSLFDHLKKYMSIDFYGVGFPNDFDPLERKYDIFILYFTGSKNIYVPKTIDAFKIIFSCDEMVNTGRLVKACKVYGANLILTKMMNGIEAVQKRIKIPIHHVPHSFESSIFRDYDEKKSLDITMMGTTQAAGNVYSLRKIISDEVVKLPNSQVYDKGRKSPTDVLLKLPMDTAISFNRSKIAVCVTPDGKKNFLVAKYFEIPACRSMLLCNDAESRSEFLTDGVHCVVFDGGVEDFHEKYNYFLSHDGERNIITENGYRLVHEKHSHGIRTIEIMEIIKKYI